MRFQPIAHTVFFIALLGAFLGLAAVVFQCRGKAVNKDTDRILQQYTLGVSTALTIGFAAILGTALRDFALWKVETRGMQLGAVEHLIQSKTLFSAISAQFTLRRTNPAALLLLVTWMLSPLGSQAALRLVNYNSNYDLGSTVSSFLDTISWTPFFNSPKNHPTQYIFTSGLFERNSLKNTSTDRFGNVKIPFLDKIPADNDTTWYPVDGQNLPSTKYSALLGLPLKDVSTTRNSTMMVESSHIQLVCTDPDLQSEVDTITYLKEKRPDLTPFPDNVTDSSYASVPVVIDGDTGLAIRYTGWVMAYDQFVSLDAKKTELRLGIPSTKYKRPWSVNSTAPLPRGTLLVQTINGFSGHARVNSTNYKAALQPWVSQCTPYQIYVQSNISCSPPEGKTDQPTCYVTAQRNSPRSSTSNNLTMLSYTTNFWQISHHLRSFTNLGYGNSSVRWLMGSLVPYYLQDPDGRILIDKMVRSNELANLSGVSGAQFAARMGQLLNTYLVALYSASSQYRDEKWVHKGREYSLYNETVAATSLETVVYDIHWAWMTVYLVSISVLVLATIVSSFCAFNTTIPDLLGYCSSAVVDSIWFRDHPDVACYKHCGDGMAMARKLKDVQVGIGQLGRAGTFSETSTINLASPMSPEKKYMPSFDPPLEPDTHQNANPVNAWESQQLYTTDVSEQCGSIRSKYYAPSESIKEMLSPVSSLTGSRPGSRRTIEGGPYSDSRGHGGLTRVPGSTSTWSTTTVDHTDDMMEGRPSPPKRTNTMTSLLESGRPSMRIAFAPPHMLRRPVRGRDYEYLHQPPDR